MHGRGHVWQGRACMAGMCKNITFQGTCMAGECVWWGACVAGLCMGGESYVVGACVAGETATAMGDTHPTGMHSCCPNISFTVNYN